MPNNDTNKVDVKALRKSLNLSQDQLAVKLGVAPFTVRRWESGISKPSSLALRQLHRLQRKVK